MCGLDVFVGRAKPMAVTAYFLINTISQELPIRFSRNLAGTLLRVCCFAEREMDDLDILFKVTEVKTHIFLFSLFYKNYLSNCDAIWQEHSLVHAPYLEGRWMTLTYI